MSANYQLTTKSANSPCGCGGATTTPANCACGGRGCKQCHTQVFVRPNFFAGQLLTEEDLQLLGDYAVAKNRLHNRFLFGAGVVCGLEVACHPCGGGQVIVQPGYALDCCGNDLTLACATPLDIIALARELRIRQLGYDCGDPCAETPAPKSGEHATLGTTGPAPAAPSATHHYCLYLHYCEELSDPVAPYPTGEACGGPGCQPTRVREGVRFELRCGPEQAEQTDFYRRLCECGDVANLPQKSVTYTQFYAGLAGQLRETPVKVERDPQGFLNSLKQTTSTMEQSLSAFNQTGGKFTDEDTAQDFTTKTVDLAAEVARFQQSNPEVRAALLKEQPDLGAALDNASKRLQEANKALAANLTIFSSEVGQLHAAEVVRLSGKLPTLPVGGVVINRAAALAAPDEAPEEINFEELAQRRVVSRAIWQTAQPQLEILRDWLRDRLARTPYLADCGLRDEVETLRIPALSADGRPPANLEELSRQLDDLLERYLRACFCAAVNPVCQPCEDTGVLLACLDVQDCKVVRVCNAERRFVLSPAALRYWLPPLGPSLEAFCCAPPAPLTIDTGVVHDRLARPEHPLLAIFKQACTPRTSFAALSGTLSLMPRAPSATIDPKFEGGTLISQFIEPRGIAPRAVPVAAPGAALSDLSPAALAELRAMIQSEVAAKMAAAAPAPAPAPAPPPAETQPAPQQTAVRESSPPASQQASKRASKKASKKG